MRNGADAVAGGTENRSTETMDTALSEHTHTNSVEFHRSRMDATSGNPFEENFKMNAFHVQLKRGQQVSSARTICTKRALVQHGGSMDN